MESEKVKEIKKVLECCYILTNKDLPMETRDNACNNCPYDGIERCTPLLVKNSLTYINELERENERLKNESNEMFDKYGKELQTTTILIEKRNNEIIELKDRIAELEKENAELKVDLKNSIDMQKEMLDGFKTAIKEVEENLAREIPNLLKQFAERVKMEFYYEFDEIIPSIMSDKIDKILKEILGE